MRIIVTDPENDMDHRVAERLGLLGVAGSEAHRLDEVEKCVTNLEREVRTERELIQEIRGGRFAVEMRR